MKIMKLFLFSLAILFSTKAINAQSADEIIAKHIEAIGGKEKLSGINSIRMENSINVMGNDAPGTTIVLNGKGYRNESEFNGQKIIQVYTDKGGWAVNPFAGGAEPEAMPENQYKAGLGQLYIVPLLNYAARGDKAELLGQEKLGNVNAYKLKLTTSDNISTTYYFNPSTYYILQTKRSAEMMGQQVEVTATYSDYKKTDYGWLTPYTMDISFGEQFSMTAKVNKLEVNAPVDAAIFQMKK
jgi:hypothetical protein